MKIIMKFAQLIERKALKYKVMLLFTWLILCAEAGMPQTSEWVQVDSPLGGATFSMAAEQSTGRLLAISANGVHHSSDNGETWPLVNQHFRYIKVLEQDSPGVLYAGTYKSISVSYDFGVN